MAERETLRHGGLTVTTRRLPDGRLTVDVDPGLEILERVRVVDTDPVSADPDAEDFREFVETWCGGDPFDAAHRLLNSGVSNKRASELWRGYVSQKWVDSGA
ncbi:hypothetical protein [Amycolatopsis lexingtonensis]|uniref:hypothetical protein n=1 Tax=Amycolatopsis lexingtonensis TaxID=218822 RepID=UPI003F724A5A